MIQRIQSLYILLAMLLGMISLFLPWVSYDIENTIVVFQAFSFEEESLHTMFATALIVFFLGITLVSLLTFKKRKQQMNLIKLSMMLSILVILGFAFDHYNNIQSLSAVGDLTMSYELPVVFPVVNLILLWLALRGVKKDEDLIKSVDRLR